MIILSLVVWCLLSGSKLTQAQTTNRNAVTGQANNEDCGGETCLGRQQCVENQCFCPFPYFTWNGKDGKAANYPCFHELCGTENITKKNFTNYIGQLQGKKFFSVAAFKGLHFCQYGVCHTTVNESSVQEYHCKCDKNVYVGDHCEYTWDICSSEPCLNGGTCKSSESSDAAYQYSCICQPQYEGALCHRTRDECQVEPCLNGGVCLNFHPGYGELYYLCLCPTGYDGERCEDDSRRRSVDQTQMAVIMATMFLIVSLLICCATTSHFRQREAAIWGDGPGKITERNPKLLERLYKIKDAINKLEAEGGFRAFYEQMELMRPGGGRISIGGGGGKSKEQKHISTTKGAMAFFNTFKRSVGTSGKVVPSKARRQSKVSNVKKKKSKGRRESKATRKSSKARRPSKATRKSSKKAKKKGR